MEGGGDEKEFLSAQRGPFVRGWITFAPVGTFISQVEDHNCGEQEREGNTKGKQTLLLRNWMRLSPSISRSHLYISTARSFHLRPLPMRTPSIDRESTVARLFCVSLSLRITIQHLTSLSLRGSHEMGLFSAMPNCLVAI